MLNFFESSFIANFCKIPVLGPEKNLDGNALPGKRTSLICFMHPRMMIMQATMIQYDHFEWNSQWREQRIATGKK